MILTITGHRMPGLDLSYSKSDEDFLYDFTKDIISDIMPDAIITGMANGFDITTAKVAISLKIPFIAALPFDNPIATWPYPAQIEWCDILDKARQKHVICPGGPANYKYIVRDKWMVDKGTEVLALYNGIGKGGTYETIKYATEKGKKINNIFPEFKTRLLARK